MAEYTFSKHYTNHLCTIANIDVVLEREILNPYTTAVQQAMKRGIDVTAKEMVAQTKKTANRDGGKWKGFPKHRDGGTYAKHHAWRGRGEGVRHYAIWYVRSPEYRLTHLLVHGHGLVIFGNPTGRRTQSFPWLSEAADTATVNVIPNIKKEIP